MNDSLTHQEYISYTLHPSQQQMGYTTLNGVSAQQLGAHQQQYGVMHTHTDLLQQAANGLLASEAPDGPLMMSSTVGTTGGVLLTLNGTGAMHNGNTSLNQQSQQAQQYNSTLNVSTGSPLGTVLVSTTCAAGETMLGSPQPGSQSTQSRSSANSASTNNSPPMHSSKKKRKF